MTTKKNSPCLLSNNEPCYIASSLKQYLCKEYNIRHIFRARGENQENTRPNKYHLSPLLKTRDWGRKAKQ